MKKKRLIKKEKTIKGKAKAKLKELRKKIII